jgi:hypothetical protein
MARMKRFYPLLLTIAALAGCGISPGRRDAYVQCVCPRGEPPSYVVSLTTPTDKWRISGHGLGLYKELRMYSVRLPERPARNAKFLANQITVFETSSGSDVPVAISGGHIEFSAEEKALRISLETPEGAFWANGRYPVNAF